VEKVRQLKAMIQAQGLNTLIEVDGGVNFENVKVLAEAGADIVVAGSTVFSAPDPTEAISRLTHLK
jgi:ribulose-phosphate 3-epimerase